MQFIEFYSSNCPKQINCRYELGDIHDMKSIETSIISEIPYFSSKNQSPHLTSSVIVRESSNDEICTRPIYDICRRSFHFQFHSKVKADITFHKVTHQKRLKMSLGDGSIEGTKTLKPLN